MSGYLADVAAESTRRRLTEKQADTVRRLTTAAVEEVQAVGYAQLTVRSVASRAGVAAATAYVYFSSKEHLLAEVFWRELQALDPIQADERAPVDRVIDALREIALLVSNQPELAVACTTALLDTNPNVHDLQGRIGLTMRQRLAAALGDDYNPTVLTALEMAYSGAMVHAGMGFTSYHEVADQLAEVAKLIMGSAQ
jgi:AcrR family transcriptional regulator